MAPKKRTTEEDGGSDKKRRKGGPSGTSSACSALAASSAAAAEEERQLSVVIEANKVSGVLLLCGGTNWDLIGRKCLPKGAKNIGGRNLWNAHRIASLKDVTVHTAVSGCMACHSVAMSTDGKVYSWGRNETGQLGVAADTERREVPTLISSLSNYTVVNAACGRGHTLFLTDRGTVFAVGCNVNGQLGVGNQCPMILMPTKVQYKGPPIRRVAAGAEFSTIADMVGNLYTFGSPEYGQLGHNTDGKYFATSTKLSFSCETRPRRVMVFIDKLRDGTVNPVTDVDIVDIASGANHVVALDGKGRVFTWGFGGYGRLGHDENKDEMVPRLVKFFEGPNRQATSIAAGSTFCLAVNKLGVLYLWGQTKMTGEATMYPKPVHDLSGWNIRSIGCCHKSIVIAADNSVISWGCSPTYGELGYGVNGVKSSTTPQEMKPLEGIYIHKVGCGWGHSLLIARCDSDEDRTKLEALPEFVP